MVEQDNAKFYEFMEMLEEFSSEELDKIAFHAVTLILEREVNGEGMGGIEFFEYEEN